MDKSLNNSPYIVNNFIITSNNIEQEFSNGWHLIGTPVILDSTVSMQSHINDGTN